jgi:long-subunit acyl-CoA synthetase (AMP-forming)
MPLATLWSYILETTLISQFLKHVSARPEDVALRHKKNGIWREIAWSDYGLSVETWTQARGKSRIHY